MATLNKIQDQLEFNKSRKTLKWVNTDSLSS